MHGCVISYAQHLAPSASQCAGRVAKHCMLTARRQMHMMRRHTRIDYDAAAAQAMMHGVQCEDMYTYCALHKQIRMPTTSHHGDEVHAEKKLLTPTMLVMSSVLRLGNLPVQVSPQLKLRTLMLQCSMMP
jgi:hypothetical protein